MIIPAYIGSWGVIINPVWFEEGCVIEGWKDRKDIWIERRIQGGSYTSRFWISLPPEWAKPKNSRFEVNENKRVNEKKFLDNFNGLEGKCSSSE